MEIHFTDSRVWYNDASTGVGAVDAYQNVHRTESVDCVTNQRAGVRVQEEFGGSVTGVFCGLTILSRRIGGNEAARKYFQEADMRGDEVLTWCRDNGWFEAHHEGKTMLELRCGNVDPIVLQLFYTHQNLGLWLRNEGCVFLNPSVQQIRSLVAALNAV